MANVKQNITAIIYDKRGMVLSIGQNSYVKTHPRQAAWAKKAGLPEKEFLHAEISAIIRCRDLTRAHRIFISRLDKDGKPMLAAPCPVCASALKATGIKVIQHT